MLVRVALGLMTPLAARAEFSNLRVLRTLTDNPETWYVVSAAARFRRQANELKTGSKKTKSRAAC